MTFVLFFLLCTTFVHAEEEEGSIIVEDTASSGDQAGAQNTVVVNENTPKNAEIADLLQQIPGSYVRRFGGLGAFSAVSIRGSSTRQTTIYINEIPINPEGVSTINLSELPLHAFSKVDVYRSHAPLSFQNASIGGAVNLNSRDTDGYNLIASIGDLGTQRIRGFVGRSSTQIFLDLFHTQGDYLFFDDNQTIYQTEDDQYQKRMNNDKWQGSMLAQHAFNDWTIMHSGAVRSEGIPGSIAMETEKVRLETHNHLSSIQWKKEGMEWGHRVLGWNLFRLEEFDDRAGEVYGGEQWNRWNFHSLGVRNFHQHNSTKSLIPSFGITYRWERAWQENLLQESEEEDYSRMVTKAQIGKNIFLFDDQLSILGALQEHLLLNIYSAELEPTLATTGRASVLFRPFGTIGLWSSIQSGFRPPDLTELFGNRGMILGNSDLLPERALTWDMGVSWKREDLSFNVQGAYFRRNAKDDIILLQNAQRQSIPTNFAQTHTQGLELALGWRPLPFVQWSGAATYMYSEQKTDIASLSGKQLPNVPQWIANSQTNINYGSVRAGHGVYFVDGNPTDAINRYWSPPRMMHNVSLQWDGEGIRPSIAIEVRNMANKITEETEIDPLQPALGLRTQAVSDFIGYPMPGRFWMCTLSWNDTKKKAYRSK